MAANNNITVIVTYTVYQYDNNDYHFNNLISITDKNWLLYFDKMDV